VIWDKTQIPQNAKPTIVPTNSSINHVPFSMQNRMLLAWESVARDLNSVPRHGAGL
jgi:hypothetical protein